MNKRKKLKSELGEKYFYKKYMSAGEVKKLLSSNSRYEYLYATLCIGCVKINAVIYPTPIGAAIGYDILVKDIPESTEWICFDTLTDEVKYKAFNFEQEMFNVLDKEVRKYELSYTNCNFEVINGKIVKTK